jgi:TatA/E family protein of Tat protein translocase
VFPPSSTWVPASGLSGDALQSCCSRQLLGRLNVERWDALNEATNPRSEFYPNKPRKVDLALYLLILDSLGSTELLFILVIALVFFGPRKLPQLSRSLGKSMAEFRKASEDFKRTWEREVALETAQLEDDGDEAALPQDTSIMNPDARNQEFQEPAIGPVPAEHVMARQATTPTDPATPAAESSTTVTEPRPAQPLRKQDWL